MSVFCNEQSTLQFKCPLQENVSCVDGEVFWDDTSLSWFQLQMFFLKISHTQHVMYVMYNWFRENIHSVFCLTTGPKPPLKRFLHIMRSRASSFKWEYPLLSLRSSSSFLCLLPRLVTSICPFIFPSITCFRRQLGKIYLEEKVVHLMGQVCHVHSWRLI